jgi:hypothetical protein
MRLRHEATRAQLWLRQPRAKFSLAPTIADSRSFLPLALHNEVTPLQVNAAIPRRVQHPIYQFLGGYCHSDLKSPLGNWLRHFINVQILKY